MYYIDDIFPFKIEIGNILIQYNQVLSNSNEPNSIHNANRDITKPAELRNYLFAFYLIYLDLPEKTKREFIKVAENNKKDYYVVEPKKEQMEVIKLYNNIRSFSMEQFTKEEEDLFYLTGVEYQRFDDLKNVYDYIKQQMENIPELKETFSKVISLDLIRHWYGVIRSLGFNLNYTTYKTIIGGDITEFPGGNLNTQILNTLTGSKLFN